MWGWAETFDALLQARTTRLERMVVGQGWRVASGEGNTCRTGIQVWHPGAINRAHVHAGAATICRGIDGRRSRLGVRLGRAMRTPPFLGVPLHGVPYVSRGGASVSLAAGRLTHVCDRSTLARLMWRRG